MSNPLTDLKKWEIVYDLTLAAMLIDSHAAEVETEQLGAWVWQIRDAVMGACLKRGMPGELCKLRDMKDWLNANKPKETT